MVSMNEDVWLSDVQQRAWVKFIAVVELLPGVLDSQLQHDADLTHFEYFTLAMLSEAPNRVFRMTELASATNSTLPRLSHVVSRLEKGATSSALPAPKTVAPRTPSSPRPGGRRWSPRLPGMSPPCERT